jgi:hypothetical protein
VWQILILSIRQNCSNYIYYYLEKCQAYNSPCLKRTSVHCVVYTKVIHYSPFIRVLASIGAIVREPNFTVDISTHLKKQFRVNSVTLKATFLCTRCMVTNWDAQRCTHSHFRKRHKMHRRCVWFYLVVGCLGHLLELMLRRSMKIML